MFEKHTFRRHHLLATQLVRLPRRLKILELPPPRFLRYLPLLILFANEAVVIPDGFRIVIRLKRGILCGSKLMRAPYGLEIIESCLSCPHREERLFCNLSGPALEALASITSPASYPKGATLYVEGQSPRGVFILCTGRVKLSTSSAEGRTLILRLAEAGDVLGMPGTLTGKPYELTADVLEPTQANFIHRQDFLNFLRDHGEAALSVAQQLGEIYHSAVLEMRNIGLSHSVAEKLARFLLDLSAQTGDAKETERDRADRADRAGQTERFLFF